MKNTGLHIIIMLCICLSGLILSTGCSGCYSCGQWCGQACGKSCKPGGCAFEGCVIGCGGCISCIEGCTEGCNLE